MSQSFGCDWETKLASNHLFIRGCLGLPAGIRLERGKRSRTNIGNEKAKRKSLIFFRNVSLNKTAAKFFFHEKKFCVNFFLHFVLHFFSVLGWSSLARSDARVCVRLLREKCVRAAHVDASIVCSSRTCAGPCVRACVCESVCACVSMCEWVCVCESERERNWWRKKQVCRRRSVTLLKKKKKKRFSHWESIVPTTGGVFLLHFLFVLSVKASDWSPLVKTFLTNWFFVENNWLHSGQKSRKRWIESFWLWTQKKTEKMKIRKTWKVFLWCLLTIPISFFGNENNSVTVLTF